MKDEANPSFQSSLELRFSRDPQQERLRVAVYDIAEADAVVTEEDLIGHVPGLMLAELLTGGDAPGEERGRRGARGGASLGYVWWFVCAGECKSSTRR